MPHFVTSAQGKAHVTSANAAHLTAGLLGNGCYVLPIGQKLACTMIDSNTLRVLFGVASVCGRQWEIEGDYEEVNIDNGVPGYNRTDLLVCRIETAPQETIALKVYKGEETTGTPVVPGHVEGDLNDGDTVCEMPICSVRVNGINPQAPEILAKESIDIMALLQELRDYKSQCPYAVGDLYITKKAGNPKDKWPGTTWTQITGRFLRAANDVLTGGSDWMTLAIANLPAHYHAMIAHAHGVGTLAIGSNGAHAHNVKMTDGNWPRYYASNAGAGSLWQVATRNSSNSGGTAGLVTESGGGHSHTITGSTASGGGGNTGSAGSGTAFDNRPAYQDVYVWERTA